jgi:hypothetical protein
MKIPRDETSENEDADGVTEEDVRHWVHYAVWGGDYDAEEIVLLIEDQLGEDDEVDEPWLRKLIRTEYASKRKAEKTWPKVTDFDRLDRVFQKLHEQGMIALHNAGFTQSDGLDFVEESYRDSGGVKSNYAGHCFYTEQDQECAIDGGGLFLGFGHLTGDSEKGVEVGNRIRESLQKEGFEVDWDGTIKKRLFMPKFRWHRRTP